jgi:hypothetical protein
VKLEMQRLGKFLLGFSMLAACSRTLGGDVPDGASIAGRGGNERGVGGAGLLGVGGDSSNRIGGVAGGGFLAGIGGAGGRGFGSVGGVGGVASAGSFGVGGYRVGTTGGGGGSGVARDASIGTEDASHGTSIDASIDASLSFCALPSGPTDPVANIVVTWCDAAQTCAMCSWNTGGTLGGFGAPVGPCTLPPLLCPPPTSGAIAAGGLFPVCSAHPDGEIYEGVLVQLDGTTVVAPSVTVATSCSGLDNDGAGNLPVFDFDVTPCGLGHPTCVAQCSDCP